MLDMFGVFQHKPKDSREEWHRAETDIGAQLECFQPVQHGVWQLG